MSTILEPELPDEIEFAARSGELVVFVGAGISRLIQCPSWDEFADGVLKQLVPNGIDYYELGQIKEIRDPKKRLAIAKIVAKNKKIDIDYAKILEGVRGDEDVYRYLNKFNCSFVTTNYEKYLAPISRLKDPEDQWRFYKVDDLLGAHLDLNGTVVHLHGCVSDSDSMVITTKEYLEHYSLAKVQTFLTYLFETKTILFLGYGLDEIEVLEYILRRGKASSEIGKGRIRRYILEGFFDAETGFHKLLSEYYLDLFAIQLLRFPRNIKNYEYQVDLLASWSTKLQFNAMALSDQAAILLEEIGE